MKNASKKGKIHKFFYYVSKNVRFLNLKYIYLTQAISSIIIFIMPDHRITTEDFDHEFNNEEKCLKYLMKIKYANGEPICSVCGKKMWNVRKITYECKCGHQKSVLSGTIFQDSHKPLRLWFRAIWYIAKCLENKKAIIALEFQQDLGIKSYKTAWIWVHKLRRILMHPDRDQLFGEVEVAYTYIEIPRKTGKDSKREQEKILIAMAMEILSGKIKRIRISMLPNSSRESRRNFRQENTKDGKVTEILYQQNIERMRINTIISPLKEWLKTLAPGSNTRKYIQCYFDEYSFLYNYSGKANRGELFDRLIKNAVLLKPITYQDIIV